MTDQTLPAAIPQPDAKRKPGSLLLSFVWWVGIAMFAIGLATSFWTDSPMGAAVPNLVRQSATILAVICGIVWFVFGSRFIKGLVVQFTILGAVALLPFVLIKGIEFTGDMGMIVHWRWSPSQEDRLAEFEASNQGAVTDPSREDLVPVIGPFDMPSFNGPAYDGRVPGPGLLETWESQPPTKLWERPVGAGYAGVAIVDHYIVTLEQRSDDEWVTCYDLQTKQELWHHSYPASFQEAAGGNGPRSTPLITENGKVYTCGAMGDVCCLDLVGGHLNWHVNVLSEHHLKTVQWGQASSAVLWQNHLIINVGGPEGKGLVALDAQTGRPIWQAEGVTAPHPAEYENRAGYSTPFVTTIDGVEQIIHLDGEGLRGYVPDTGVILWSYAFSNQPGVNVAQPIVFPDGRVFITCSYGVGCRMLQVSQAESGWQVADVWGHTRMRCKFCSPILIDGYIYGLDEGVLSCLDAETGERQWRAGRYGHGQMLLRGEHLVVFTEAGEIALVHPNPTEFEEVARLPVFDRDKNWNPPGLANDVLVVRNHFDMAAFRLPVQ